MIIDLFRNMETPRHGVPYVALRVSGLMLWRNCNSDRTEDKDRQLDKRLIANCLEIETFR